jgi:hypothetical protein
MWATSFCSDKWKNKMTTDRLSQHAIQDRTNRTQAEWIEKQYSISQILWIWAVATIPGALLFWVGLPGYLLYSTFTLALPARLFRSTWFSTAVHLSQGFYFLFLTFGLVLGLA